MHQLTARLLTSLRKQESIRAGDRVAVAVSGGADSVALLCLLLEVRSELGIVLSVAHVNHKLRAEESDDDQKFVALLAQRYGLELHICEATVEPNQHSDSYGITSGIEAVARELRYLFFRRLAVEDRATKIATAHTLDDQAETVLMRIFRGTGIRGLSGVHPRIILKQGERVLGAVIRPLLGFRRLELQDFLRERDQIWREDSSNRNLAFLRNRVRHRLIPVITEEFGKAAIGHMSNLAEIARAEEDWNSHHPEIHNLEDRMKPSALPVKPLLALPLAVQRRVVRDWLQRNSPELGISFHLIEEALDLAKAAPGGKTQNFRRGRSELFLRRSDTLDGDTGANYEHRLSIPGAVHIPELNAHVEVRVTEIGEVPETERQQLLDPDRITKEVTIRNWRPGDRYWPAHTAREKKVKELLGDRHATGAEKRLWPVAVVEGNILVWMRGFAAPAALQASPRGNTAIRIRECRS